MATNIRLTPTHVVLTEAPKISGAPPRVATQPLKRVIPMIFPLNMIMLMLAEDGEHVEVSHGNNMNLSWICAETWLDVVQAMSEPVPGSLVQPIFRHPAITAAAANVVREEREAATRRAQAERQKFPMPVKAGELMQGESPNAGLMQEAVEVLEGAGYIAKDEPPAGEMTGDVTEAAERATWNDIMPASSREVQPGDLRIVPVRLSGGFWIEIAEAVDGGFQWTRATVPGKLLATFPSFAGAAQAIRIAGLAHRLIDQDDQAA